MKNKIIGKYLKYVISLGISLGILSYLFKDEDLASLLAQAKQANYSWILLSIILAMISHLIRAYRWKLFVKPLGFDVSLIRSFLAVMIGYVTNLLLPRMGEIIKCGALHKLERVPISKSFGTIITERIIDMAFLMILLGVTFLLEYQKLKDYLYEIFGEKYRSVAGNLSIGFWAVLGILIFIIACFLIYANLEKLKKYPFVKKALVLLRDVLEGLTSIRKIKNQSGFWISSVAIWVLYYIMSYVVIFALPATSALGPVAGLSILAMGSIGMAAPVQGGIGTYHFMVTSVLILYGIDQSQGKLFATLLHTSQTLGVVVVGVISFFISTNLVKKGKQDQVFT